MVKKKKGNEQSLYLLAIVSIVAIVGVVVLVLNAGGDEESSALVVDENGDVVGMALSSKMTSADMQYTIGVNAILSQLKKDNANFAVLEENGCMDTCKRVCGDGTCTDTGRGYCYCDSN